MFRKKLFYYYRSFNKYNSPPSVIYRSLYKLPCWCVATPALTRQETTTNITRPTLNIGTLVYRSIMLHASSNRMKPPLWACVMTSHYLDIGKRKTRNTSNVIPAFDRWPLKRHYSEIDWPSHKKRSNSTPGC